MLRLTTVLRCAFKVEVAIFDVFTQPKQNLNLLTLVSLTLLPPPPTLLTIVEKLRKYYEQNKRLLLYLEC